MNRGSRKTHPRGIVPERWTERDLSLLGSGHMTIAGGKCFTCHVVPTTATISVSYIVSCSQLTLKGLTPSLSTSSDRRV